MSGRHSCHWRARSKEFANGGDDGGRRAEVRDRKPEVSGELIRLVTADATMGCGGALFAEDFFDVADFFLDFAAGLFGGAAIFHVAVTGRAPGCLFYFAGSFFRAAFDFVFCARSHTRESRGRRSQAGEAKEKG